jgi:hypothetical protein
LDTPCQTGLLREIATTPKLVVGERDLTAAEILPGWFYPDDIQNLEVS